MYNSRQDVHEEIDRRQGKSVNALRRWLQQLAFSDTGMGIADGAVYTRDLLASIAKEAVVLITDGHPIVLGTVQSRRTNAPTLIIYGLYDVPPLIEDEWNVNPLSGAILEVADIDIPSLDEPILVGHGVHHHKSPLLANILAVKAMLDVMDDIPVNLIYVIEGEGQIGSPSLAGFVNRYRELLSQADGCWMPGMQQTPTGHMLVHQASKGIFFAELECRAGDKSVPQFLSDLDSLFDDETIGNLQTNSISRDDIIHQLRQQFRDHPEWEATLLRNTHSKAKPLADDLAQEMFNTTFDLQDISSTEQLMDGDTQTSSQISANIEVKLAPGINYQQVVGLIQIHLQNRGYERVEVKNIRGYNGSFALFRQEDTLLSAARQTAKQYDIPLIALPIATHNSPASILTQIDKPIPFSVAGFGHGGHSHAHNEYIALTSMNAHMHWTVDYLASWAEIYRINAGAETREFPKI